MTGNYTSPDSSLQIVLPSNWTGSVFQNQNATVTTIRAVPNDLQQQAGQGFRAADSMTIRIVPKSMLSGGSNSSRPFQFGQGGNFQNRGNLTCTPGSPQPATINGMNGIVTTTQCTSPNFSFSTKTYAFQTPDKLYSISFMSSSSDGSAKYMPAFDGSVNTLKIANTIQAPTVPEFPLATVGIVFAGAIGVFAIVQRRRSGEKHSI